MTKVPERIKQLIDTFARNIDAYKKGEMNETQLRREYLDPFFTELGWDVENKKGYASAYKEVSHEFSLKTKDVREAPDYCFRIGQTPKFFLEAKKPSVNLKDDIHPAFQVRSYAWSAKLPLSILTDFEEFAVYDCRIPPHKNDKASAARVIYYTYNQYIEKWEEISGIFSRDAILKGSFDKYVESNKKKKGTAEVDSVFLKQMEEWRKLIARNIALRNSALNIRELNFVVQKTIDRIIFLRICEDRGIEDYGQLLTLQNGVNIYERLKQIFQRADEKYNSGLFHFDEEKGRGEEPDNLSLSLKIDDKVLKDIFKNLYYPNSPYEFSVLPADILGQVYEQFLGKVIRLTPSHQAVVEDKPEVKKAGGVYYTPTYIVDYIVQNTLGKLIPPFSKEDKGKFKNPKEAEKIKILDPACGSGSFLIGAFQYLLNWHLEYYTSDDDTIQKYSSQKQPAIYQASNGDWLLTTTEKKRILLNNIYGVDIDSQAVEVTKLSLLLKVLEGESEQTILNQMKFFRERALPDLSNNIKCGNSLIGPDFYDQMEMNFLDDEEKLKINVFDWKAEFPKVFNDGGPARRSPKNKRGPVRHSPIDEGGFDVVIGNPPYMKTQTMQEFNPNEVEALKNIYYTASKGNFDIYVVFIEKGYTLLNSNGYLGFITPHKFFNSNYGKNLRDFISKKGALSKIIHFSDYQIFKNASTYTCLIFLNSTKHNNVQVNQIDSSKFNPADLNNLNLYDFEINHFTSNNWNIQTKENSLILDKFNNFTNLEELTTNIFQGPKSGADNVFILKKASKNGKQIVCFSQSLQKNVELEKDLIKNYVKGKFIKRYEINREESEITIYPYDDDGKLVDISSIERNYPNIYKYLSNPINKNILQKREGGKFKNTWWQYSRPQNMGIVFHKKILTPFNSFYNSFSFDNLCDFVFSAGVTGAYGIKLKDENKINYLTLLGILNSKLIFFIIKNISTCLRGGYYSFENKYIKKLPIGFINSKIIFPQIEQKVNLYLQNFTSIKSVKTPTEKTALQRQIDATDKLIDQLVYQLYGLTEEEIRIVEGE